MRIRFSDGIKSGRTWLLAGILLATWGFALSEMNWWRPYMARLGQKPPAQIAAAPNLKTTADKLEETIITPCLSQKITPGKNVLWCNTFQLAWNELCDLTGGPVQMEQAPPVVAALNQRDASTDDIDADSYVAVAGFGTEGVYEKIRGDLKRIFKGKANPQVLNSVPQVDGLVVYAYLFKQLPFDWAFTRFHGNLYFDGHRVDSFGIMQLLPREQKDEARMATQVLVLDYQTENDFVIELKTRCTEHQLLLAKVPPGETLQDTVTKVRDRCKKAQPTSMREEEDLRVPVLDFDILRDYREICGRAILNDGSRTKGGGLVTALQSIRFRLDETGAVLQSESILDRCIPPRRLVFDGPFLILLRIWPKLLASRLRSSHIAETHHGAGPDHSHSPSSH